MAKKTKKAAPQSRETASIKSFLDMIAPSVVKFEPDHFICGNTFRCVWALLKERGGELPRAGQIHRNVFRRAAHHSKRV